MKRSVITLGFISVLLNLALFAQQPPKEKEDDKSTLTGLIVIANTGEPASKARVMIMSGDGGTRLVAMAGTDGRYEFVDVRPGLWAVFVQKPGYSAPGGGVAPVGEITVATGVRTEAGTIHLLPDARLSGRISDSDGDPAPGATIALLRRIDRLGTWYFQALGRFRAGVDGEYHVNSLPGGDYYLQVSYDPLAGSTERRDKIVYAPVYYPGILDYEAAQPVHLNAGEDGRADVTLPAPKALSVRGRVAGVAKSQAVLVQISLVPVGMTGTVPTYRTEVDETGEFVFTRVPSGRYAITGRMYTPGGIKSGQVLLAVNDADVTGIVLPVENAAFSVKGRLVLEGGRKASGSSLHLHFSPVDEAYVSGDDPIQEDVAIEPDGSFEIPCDRPVRANMLPMMVDQTYLDWYVKSIRLGDKDFTDGDLVFDYASAKSTLEVVLADDGGTVAGRVVDASDKPLPYVRAVLIPEGRFIKRPDYYQPVYTDASGTFVSHGVPPADYRVIVVPRDAPELAYYDSAYTRDAIGPKLHVEPKSNTKLTLKASCEPLRCSVK